MIWYEQLASDAQVGPWVGIVLLKPPLNGHSLVGMSLAEKAHSQVSGLVRGLVKGLVRGLVRGSIMHKGGGSYRLGKEDWVCHDLLRDGAPETVWDSSGSSVALRAEAGHEPLRSKLLPATTGHHWLSGEQRNRPALCAACEGRQVPAGAK